MRSLFNPQQQISHSALSRIAKKTFHFTLVASLVSIPHVSHADGIPNQLQGEWSYGQISSMQYQYHYTAQSDGSSDRIKVKPNGDYERARLLQISTYDCASYLFIQEKGKVKIDGQKLTFEPNNSFVKGQECSASNTYQRHNTAKVETYSWSLEKNDYGQEVLVLEKLNGKDKALYGRPRKTNL